MSSELSTGEKLELNLRLQGFSLFGERKFEAIEL
jgi:hypothetical protein